VRRRNFGCRQECQARLAESLELRLELGLAQKEALMIAFLLIVATILAFLDTAFSRINRRN
jgi:hypothetical protein